MSKNLACVLHGKNDLRIEECEMPVPKAGQLLIKVHTVGICGTDVHFWTHGKIGSLEPKKPMIMGHECSGVIAGIGSDVKDFALGDRVALEPGIACRKCSFCKHGRYNLCHEMEFFALPPTDGLITDAYFRIPDSMSMEEASFLEPFSVGLHACRNANIEIGDKVLVLGAGQITINQLTYLIK
ncbi:unnamed protein product [Thelazia callipaeda]|uniref:Sorbitol dehydrogenase n=1 Tax=Thelazia callipaeda TaxID=103827 RepID=A0A0N5CU04_THECL|nr:unnamed protein product [Thelazia callipaeda]